MRRLLIVLLLAACLLPDAGPARAQATADQLNKLSLEALTAPAPGGNPGSARRPYHSSYGSAGRTYRSSGYRRSSYRRGSYRPSSYRRASRAGVRRSYSTRSYSTRSYSTRSYGRGARVGTVRRSSPRTARRTPGGYRGNNRYVPSFYRPRSSR